MSINDTLMGEDSFDIDAIIAAHQNRDVNLGPQALKEAVEQFFNQSYSFEPMQLVTWKPRMRIAQYPDIGEPAVFIRRIDDIGEARLIGKNNTICGSIRVDMEVGYLDDDGDLLFYFTDSRRWMPWEGA